MRFPGWPGASSTPSSASPRVSTEDSSESGGHCFRNAASLIPTGHSTKSSASRGDGLRLGAEPGRSAQGALDFLEDGEEGEIIGGRARASWLMIWCHERCYKPERNELRVHLTDIAMSLSAGILCMKKAMKYENWLRRSKNRFHVLITDWREAKPCWNAVEESEQQDWPEMIIVLCDLMKSHENALQWASKQDQSKVALHVVFESPGKEHFREIHELLHDCYKKMAKRRPMLVPSAPGPLAKGPDALDSSSGTNDSKVMVSEANSDELREAIRNGKILSL